MDADEFRRYGHEVVDWIADYLSHIRDYPVLPDVEPGWLASQLPVSAPENGEPMDAILRDFREKILPAVTHWNHPRFLAYFAVSGSPPGILGEMLSAALNVNGMHWRSCPAVTELEQVALGWLRKWMGLPDEFFGIVYDTASVSSMHAIAAAREMADPEARVRGARGNLVLYTSDQAHSSIEKGAIAVGVGQQNVRKINSDAAFRMDTKALRQAIETDLKAGKRPFCVVATAGTTSTTSIDPVPAIADVAGEFGLWLHVDAAYAGSAAVVPELRWVLNGAERADSVVTNPHKWLFTPIDFSAFYTRRPDILRRAFTLTPEYLKTAANEHAVSLMDYGVPLGRRFRALKLWMILRYYGRTGIIGIIRDHVRYAADLARLIAADPDFELAAPVPLSVICFRYKGSDEDNRRIMDDVNASGKAFLSHTVLNGRLVIRFAIGHIAVTWEDVSQVWELVKQAAKTTPAGSASRL